MKIDQIAFGCNSAEVFAKMAAKASVVDTVTFSGTFCGIEFTDKIGHLAFDYEHKIEREYLYYPNPILTFHDLLMRHKDFFFSHLGSHVDSIDLNPSDKVIMDVTTTRHKNPELIKLGRHYRYVILDRRIENGYFYKLIQRIERSDAGR